MSDGRKDEAQSKGLSRRGLLGVGAGLAAAVATADWAGALSGRASADAPALQDAACPAGFDDPAFEFAEATLSSLQDAMASGKTSSRALTEAYLGRIAALDRQGPTLAAIIESNPEALQIAEALDAERKAKGSRGPLHGIPVLLKDNIATGDRMLTTAGSLALASGPAPKDAFLVQRLRAAGAVPLGKANLSEWANFRSTHSSSGWSARGGQCRNPYALDRSPSGSSSGSGVAVAANLTAVAVGSETDGSVVSPAAASGIVGIKPTLGWVSRTGVIPIAHSQDTAGPMARTVADAAALLAALAGVDPVDAATHGAAGRALDFTRFLKPDALRGARIGVLRERYFGYSTHADAIAETALKALKDAGAELVDPANLPTASEIDTPEFEVLLFEFKADLETYFASLGPSNKIRTLEDLIKFNESERAREMPYFAQEIVEKAAAKGPLTDAAYKKALATCVDASRTRGLDVVFAKFKVDALVAPTQGPAWLIDLVSGDSVSGGSSTPAAVSGYPSVTVPAGFACGLPIGLSFIGPKWSDGKIIGFAYAFEQATKVRRQPRFLKTADLAG
ncbi:MAG: amidase [Acidobacteriota bacterium]